MASQNNETRSVANQLPEEENRIHLSEANSSIKIKDDTVDPISEHS